MAKAATATKRTVRSKEILALMRIESMLDELTPGQQARILRYFADRYVSAVPGEPAEIALSTPGTAREA